MAGDGRGTGGTCRSHVMSALDGWIDVFRAGAHRDSAGRERTWSTDDLDSVVGAYERGDPAPVVVGHPQMNAPAWGWVDALRRTGDRLQARLRDVDPAFREAVEAGRYAGRSVALQGDGDGFRLQHLGFLGGAALAGSAPLRLRRRLRLAATFKGGRLRGRARLRLRRRLPLAATFRGAALAGSAPLRLRRRLRLAATFKGGRLRGSAPLRLRLPLAATFTGAALTGSAPLRLRRRLRLAATFKGGRLRGSAPLRLVLPLAATFTGAALAGSAPLRLLLKYRYDRALRASSPLDRVLTALEIRHPAIVEPVRVVNDADDHTIEGERYVGLRFGARFADDVEGREPRAELVIDNVGRELTQWIEAAGGGVGATVRVMQVVDGIPEWEMTMDVAHIRLDQERVTARLGFDPLLGRAAVTLRHDPQTSPGLF